MPRRERPIFHRSAPIWPMFVVGLALLLIALGVIVGADL